MAYLSYLSGFLKYIFNSRVSKFALIDKYSIVNSKARLCRNTKSFHSKIDAYTYVAPGTELTYAKIGKFCSIGRSCYIGLPSHPIYNVSTSPIFISKKNVLKFTWTNQNIFEEFKEVIIGNDVWIGSRAIIMGGVSIGNGAVIGAGAIVTRDVSDYAIVAGVPAKVIKYRFNDEIIEALQNMHWWDLPEKFLKSNLSVFQKEKINISDLNKIISENKQQ